MANDFEPAFPIPADAECSGMTLRDWFAGLALQALLANPGDGEFDIATVAYEHADAMLEARDE